MTTLLKISPIQFIVIFLAFLAALIMAESCSPDGVVNIPDDPDFNFDIRPILSDNCFLCHGPDPSTREAGLRLDIEAGATAVLKSGKRAIVPGHPEQSELIQRITCPEEDDRMPPVETKKKLSKRQIALLKKWIENGAEWQPYWAFVSPEKINIADDYSGNKIDFFINKKLKENNLKPAKIADKNELIRRLNYLLIGLPPTPEEVEGFLNDNSDHAYEKLVDKLLASPHFGERWARHWMDLVRYADTRGHEYDYPVVGAWRYRDYLIRAFNNDVPYDQFVKEHLAGDLLPQPRFSASGNRNESAIATAFFTMGEGTHSPVDIRKDEADRIDNMIDVTTKTFQAMTVACARCHDHKFDPLPTADYYSLYGIMESTRFSVVPARTGLQSLALVDSIEKYKKYIRHLSANISPIDLTGQTVVTSQPSEKPVFSKNNKIELIGDFRDGSLSGWFATGLAFKNGNALGEPVFDFSNKKITQLETGKASSRVLGKGLQGALRSPTFIIEKEKVLVRAAGEHATIRVVIDNFQLIQDPIYGGLQKQVVEGEMKNYELDVSMWKGRKAYIEILPGQYVPVNGKQHHFEIKKDAWIEVEYALASDGGSSNIPQLFYKKTKTKLKSALRTWASGNSSPEGIDLINRKLKTGKLHLPITLAQAFIKKNETWEENLYDSTFISGVTEGDAVFSPIFMRGDCHQLDKEKQPHRNLTALGNKNNHFSQKGSGRLELADAIAHPKNPLTARVMANRIWHHLFGRGIVETVDNFGLQGKPPTHPDLLDYLAIEFVENGWSVKKMIRYIVLSDAFKRSTLASKKSQQNDPQNLWLQHFPIRRLEAEAIRDGILTTSGRLERALYGEPFEVYLTDFLEGRGRPPASGELDGNGRRSIYQAIRRNFLPQMMMAFDMPTPFSTFGKRNTSNVPAQSLTLLNDPFVHQQAVFWAERILAKETEFEERIKNIYLTAYGRMPLKKEINAAKEFFLHGSPFGNENKNATELQKWTDYCHTIFNMKEFIFLK